MHYCSFFLPTLPRAPLTHCHRGLEVKRQTLQFTRKTLRLTHSAKPMFLGRHATLHLPHPQCYLHFSTPPRLFISQIRNETCNISHAYPHHTHIILAICSLALPETPEIHTKTKKTRELLFFKGFAVHALQCQVSRSAFCKSQITTADQNFRNKM